MVITKTVTLKQADFAQCNFNLLAVSDNNLTLVTTVNQKKPDCVPRKGNTRKWKYNIMHIQPDYPFTPLFLQLFCTQAISTQNRLYCSLIYSWEPNVFSFSSTAISKKVVLQNYKTLNSKRARDDG